MKRSSPSSTRTPRDNHALAGNGNRATCVIGEHSCNELFEQHMLLPTIRNLYKINFYSMNLIFIFSFRMWIQWICRPGPLTPEYL